MQCIFIQLIVEDTAACYFKRQVIMNLWMFVFSALLTFEVATAVAAINQDVKLPDQANVNKSETAVNETKDGKGQGENSKEIQVKHTRSTEENMSVMQQNVKDLVGLMQNGTTMSSHIVIVDRPKETTAENTKSKLDQAKEQQEKLKQQAAERNPDVKITLKSIAEASDKAALEEALKKTATEASRDATISEYEKKSIAITAFSKAKMSSSGNDTSSIISSMGTLALKLQAKDYNKMSIVEITEVLRVGKVSIEAKVDVKVEISVQKAILRRFLDLLPKSSQSNSSGELLVVVKEAVADYPSGETLSKEMLQGILSFMKDMLYSCKGRPPSVFSGYLQKVNLKRLAREEFKGLGNLICYLSAQQIRDFPKSLLTTLEDVKDICKPDWEQSKISAVTALARSVDAVKNLASFDCEKIKAFGNCWGGIPLKEFKQFNISVSHIECFESGWLSGDKRETLKKKFVDSKGSFKDLDIARGRQIVKAVGVTLKMIKELPASVIKNVSELIVQQMKSGAVKNKIAKKAFAVTLFDQGAEDSNFKLSNIPTVILSTVPFASIRDLDVSKLGFGTNTTVTSETSETTDKENPEVDEPDVIDEATGGIVLQKLEEERGRIDQNVAYYVSILKSLARFACGITDLTFRYVPDDRVNDFISILNDQCQYCYMLRQAVMLRYTKLLDQQNIEAVTETDLSILGSCLIEFDLRFLVKMADDLDTRKVAIQTLQFACKAKGITKARMEQMTSVSLAMLKIRSGASVTVETIDTIGCLSQYMSMDMWKDVDGAVVEARSELLGALKLPDKLRTTMLEKLASYHLQPSFNHFSAEQKVMAFLNGTANITAETHKKYFAIILPVLDETMINSIPIKLLKELEPEIQRIDIPVNLAVAINARLQLPSEDAGSSQQNRRKRRAVTQDLSNKTAQELIEMGNRLYGLSVDDIMTINYDAFKGALHVIGALPGFMPNQLAAWKSLLKNAYGSLATLTTDDLKKVMYIMLAMTPAEIMQLDLSNLELISELSGIKGYTDTQIMAIYDEIKKDLNRFGVQNFTGEELSAMRQFLRAANESGMHQIPTMHYSYAAKDLGEVEGWTSTQMIALKSLAVSAFGGVNNWTFPVVNNIGAAVGGLTAAELMSFTTIKIQAIKPVALKQIPVDLFKEFTCDQLKSLQDNQREVIRSEMSNALSPEKMNCYNASQENKTNDVGPLLGDNTESMSSSTAMMNHMMMMTPTPMMVTSMSTMVMDTPEGSKNMDHMTSAMPTTSVSHKTYMSSSMIVYQTPASNVTACVYLWGEKCAAVMVTPSLGVLVFIHIAYRMCF